MQEVDVLSNCKGGVPARRESWAELAASCSLA